MAKLKCYGIALTEKGDVFVSYPQWGWDAPAAEERAHDSVLVLCGDQHVEYLAIVWGWSRSKVRQAIGMLS